MPVGEMLRGTAPGDCDRGLAYPPYIPITCTCTDARGARAQPSTLSVSARPAPASRQSGSIASRRIAPALKARGGRGTWCGETERMKCVCFELALVYDTKRGGLGCRCRSIFCARKRLCAQTIQMNHGGTARPSATMRARRVRESGAAPWTMQDLCVRSVYVQVQILNLTSSEISSRIFFGRGNRRADVVVCTKQWLIGARLLPRRHWRSRCC